MSINQVWIAPIAVIAACIIQAANQWAIALYNKRKDGTSIIRTSKEHPTVIKKSKLVELLIFELLFIAFIAWLLTQPPDHAGPLTKKDVFFIALNTVFLLLGVDFVWKTLAIWRALTKLN